MGLLDYNRPRIIVGDSITYDMNTAGNIFSFANTDGYNVLMIDISATIDANNTSKGLIMVEDSTSAAGGGTTYLDIFDADGRVYSPYLNNLTLDDIRINTKANTHKKFYIDITGLKTVIVKVVSTANASLKVRYSASDGDMSSIINKRAEQILLYRQFTGDGTTKSFGEYPATMFGVSPLFKFLKLTIKSSQNISGKIQLVKRFWYNSSSHIPYTVDVMTFTGEKIIESKLIDCCGEMTSTFYLYLSEALADGGTIDVIITGVR